MGCVIISGHSTEEKISVHLSRLSSLAKNAELTTEKKKFHSVEDILRKELHSIIDLAKEESALPPHIFNDLVCALDDVNMAFPGLDISTLSKASRKVVRSRTIRVGNISAHSDVDNLCSTVHVLQQNNSAVNTAKKKKKVSFHDNLEKIISAAEVTTSPVFLENKIKLTTMVVSNSSNHSSDYGFYDLSLHEQSIHDFGRGITSSNTTGSES